MKNKLILVTGGAGYIGSVLVRKLLAEEYRVRVLDSLMYGGHALEELRDSADFELIRGDIRSDDTVKQALDGVRAVVHLAAIVGDPACSRRPELAREVNLDASLQLFDLSRAAGIGRFVFASTCSNYGRMADPTKYVTEDSELPPISLYARAKVAVEGALLKADGKNDPVVTVLRFATVFGLSPRMRFDLTVNEFTRELLLHRELVIYGEQFWRPYIHVMDISRAISLVLGTPAGLINRQVFNVGNTSQNYQKGRLVELVREQIG